MTEISIKELNPKTYRWCLAGVPFPRICLVPGQWSVYELRCMDVEGSRDGSFGIPGGALVPNLHAIRSKSREIAWVDNYYVPHDGKWYEIDADALMEILCPEITQIREAERIEVEEREAAEQAEKERQMQCFARARETGDPQLLRSWYEGPCEEEGCIDEIRILAMSDGTTKRERWHSY